MCVFFTILLASCQKDELKTPTVGIVDAKYETYYKLRSFMERSEGKQPTHLALLPRTGYDVEGIVEYIEGTLNLVYADASLSWENYLRTTDTFSLSLISGYADEEDVFDVFDQARDSAALFFHSLEEADKFPKLFDVVILLSTSGQVDISVMAMIGAVRKDLTPFGEFDYWDIFEDGNTCDPQDDYMDAPYASTIMSNAIDLWYQPYGCYFYTNPLEISSQNIELDPPLVGWGEDNQTETAGDWVVDFKTLKTICDQTTSQCLEFANTGIYCLDPDEMNYYFGSLISIYDAYSYEIGLEHYITDIGLIQLTVGNYQHKTWECNDVFAELHYCDEGNEYPHLLPFCCN